MRAPLFCLLVRWSCLVLSAMCSLCDHPHCVILYLACSFIFGSSGIGDLLFQEKQGIMSFMFGMEHSTESSPRRGWWFLRFWDGQRRYHGTGRVAEGQESQAFTDKRRTVGHFASLGCSFLSNWQACAAGVRSGSDYWHIRHAEYSGLHNSWGLLLSKA